ncbi:ABC-F type ribosomal protection protein [Oceanobacillus piezotolerans]|uniref:ABC-F type ribosomal protection protein n=1 Tax=Oceanobacillus piezotolerans TaxID=2448030 RepID=A0A498D437_9BACI|nr:ABC-F type ribosomal protection protein [Oceanobacillus piezotolerans]RLL41277.1 ABC-F type ribosomal protection protein [Oceanobacillus piezotolerans]
MIILEANNISYSVRERLLFSFESLQIKKGDRIGLVGKNGSGKTTLLEILAAKRQVDEGTISTASSRTLIPQLKETDTLQSGGEVTQSHINHAIGEKADILFADEPTTNLDRLHIEKLEKQFLHWHGALVIVSHDRAFLDAICTRIWEIDDKTVNEFKGNYSDYLHQREALRKKQEHSYEQYIQKRKQLEHALEIKEQKAQRATKKPKNVSKSEASITGAKPYFAKKQKKLQKTKKALETRLERLEKVEKPIEFAQLKMELPNQDFLHGRTIIRLEGLEGRIGTRLLWESLNLAIKGGEKIAIIGENGVGKTTLLKKIMKETKGIKLSPSVKIGYFSQNLDVLDPGQSILDNVISTSIQNETMIRIILARLHFRKEDVYKKVEVLSGGERVKVAFAKIFVSNINTLILDEPTNYLDIEAMEALEDLLVEYNGTVLFVSHDRRFLDKVATKIIELKNMKFTVFDGSLKEYQKPSNPSIQREDLLVIETKITEVLSKLSLEASPELDSEFKALLQQKKAMENGRG